MSDKSTVHQNIIRNTRSNYLLIGIRMILGLVTFRLLYTGLSKEEFGFWAFLWGVFGTSVILDFGFGLTVQKQVASLSVKKHWDELSKVLTTLLTLYTGLAIILIAGAWIAAPTLVAQLNPSSENKSAFDAVMFWFLVGMGVSFPLGILPEILKGQQMIHVANNLVIAGNLVSFTLVVLALKLDLGLKMIVISAMSALLVPHIFAGILGLRSLPKVTIHPKHFTPRLISETLRFSASAYIILVSYMILTKTDQIVIGTVASMSAVALYQPAAKIGEIFGFLTRQLANTLQPAAAHLHASGDREGLRHLMLSGTRYSVMLAAPLYVFTAAYMAPIARLLTGDASLEQDAMRSAQILVFWAFTFIITHNVYKRIAVMCGQEKRLVYVGIGEAALNLGLSVGLLHIYQQVASVAFATLVSSLIFGWVFLWPWAATIAKMSPLQLAKETLARNLLGALPLLFSILILRQLSWFSPDNSFLGFLVEASFTGFIGAIGVWKISLTPADRTFVAKRINPIKRRVLG